MSQAKSASAHGAVADGGSVTAQHTVLYIEDNLSNLKRVVQILGRHKQIHLLTAHTPELGIELAPERRPELVLLDINMPHLDGYQVMEQLKALDDPLLPPIVILTAQQSRDYLLRALASGARDFVSKPFDRAELLMRVRNLLDAQLAHRLVHDQKAVLEDMVRARTEALNQTRLQVVRRLGRAAEYRDNETGLHIIRMSQFSALLAQKLGWRADDCDLMLHASPMHDIGKIGIPDAILLKQGKLDPDEWEIMKTHATIGGHILDDGDSELLRLARVIALSHHEKWDGSGYPNGLSGEAIPHSGRIVAVADVFDALTSVRPYKKAWPVLDAVAYIRDNAGTHFDPEVAARFQECLPAILAIREQYKEPEH